MSRLFAALLASVLLSAAAHAADPAKQKSDFQRRLDSVKSLSAALQRDPAATTPAGKETLATVGARQKEAEELAATGEYEVAGSVLDEAYKKLTVTLTKAKAGEGFQPKAGDDGKLSNGKPKADFERKLASATALLDAERRIDKDTGNRHQAEIASLEAGIAKAKAAAAANDLVQANRLIDEVLATEKRTITTTKANDPATAKLKTGSASLERDNAAPGGADSKAELARTLRSTTSLRDLLARRSKEGGVDRSAALGKIDQQLGEARRLESSDPKRALAAANDAYAAAKTEVEKLQRK